MSRSDKTEQPTAKKRRDARRKGQIAKSQELIGWIGLLVGSYLLPWMIGRLATASGESFRELRDVAAEPNPDLAVTVLGEALRRGFLAALPLIAVVAATSILVSLAQTGLVLTWKPIVPDPKRINPLQGFKRLFSKRSLWETVKQVAKISVVLLITWPQLMGIVELLVGRGRLPLQTGVPAVGDEVVGLVRTITWTMVILALADYGYQRYQHAQDLKMTKQEVKDEHKNTEGDAMVKGRIRALQRSMARNRMISDMGNADVVITNPTHIAVALRYDAERGGAPRVLAVGAGAVAGKIRQRARESKIPIVEAKPLARALWRACDVGDEIPAALYEAVAKVLAFVHRLDRRFAWVRTYELPGELQVSDATLQAVPRKRRQRR
ncbi:MAG: flagellar biosynthesis protein FlhB [Ilumatobacter sp.]|uniref:flagellar biosynthesis protein FlhB n=1 Tax=Ilumatobacter sp. TaxID=1967498 RepID=UPI0026053520|nr:flagellar biosynthesis protein FlhB [Ilumatobacter sp.]MDJ0767436.1 flagellar biosynthesis protein FlhB [Ilumatobacter sp.]